MATWLDEINGSFEQGWETLPITGNNGYVRNQRPSMWELEILPPGATLWDSNDKTTGEPEAVHKEVLQLPPDEHPGGENELILHGEHVYKIFCGGCAFGAALHQTIYGLVPNSSVKFYVPVQIHRHGDVDIYAAEVWASVNGVGNWMQSPDRQWETLVVEGKADANGGARLTIRVKSKWPKTKDFFIDNVRVEVELADDGETPPDPDPDPDPEPGEHTHDDLVQDIQTLATALTELEQRVIALENGTPPTNPDFQVEHWPTNYLVVTQRFGANPEYYAQFNLPGHEGIDIRALHGTPIYAVTSGEVFEVVQNEDGHNYGVRVRIRTGEYRHIYAHMIEGSVTVQVGQQVSAGDIIGLADNTGNSFGSHLHFTLKKDGADIGGYPYNIINPMPYFEVYNPDYTDNPPTTPNKVDLLDYIMGEDKIQFELRFDDGSQERNQVQHAGNGRWYIVKGEHQGFYELWYADDDWIYLIEDTSPADAFDGTRRFYRRFKTSNMLDITPMCPRHMHEGQIWQDGGHYVQFFAKQDCRRLDGPAYNSGQTGQTARCISIDKSYGFYDGITYEDVLVMQFNQETMYFVKGKGRVGWESPWGNAKISQLHAPGDRPDVVREVLGCN